MPGFADLEDLEWDPVEGVRGKTQEDAPPEQPGVSSLEDLEWSPDGAVPVGSAKPEAPEEPVPERSWYENLLDTSASVLQGATGGYADEIAGAGRYALGKLGVMPEVGDLQENVDAYQAGTGAMTKEHPYAHGAGQAALGAGAAWAAGPAVLAQGAAGALTGAAGEYGRQQEADANRVVAGGITGGALGLAGGAVGKVAGALRGKPAPPPPEDPMAALMVGSRGPAPAAQQAPQQQMPSSAMELLARGGVEAASKVPQWLPGVGAIGKYGQAAKQLGLGGAPKAGGQMIPSEGARMGGVAATQLLGTPMTSRAQEGGKAYAGTATLAYGIQSVLAGSHQGTPSGLPPEAEQRLTQAVVSGDDSKFAATDYELKQRYPAYAKRIEDELKALNEGD